MKYVRGYVSSVIQSKRTLVIELCGCKHACVGCRNAARQSEEGQGLNERLDAAMDVFEKNVEIVCFVGGEDEMQTIEDVCKSLHKKGLKTAFSTAYPELSMINKRLLDVVDFVLLGRCDQKQKILMKDYSPFGDMEDWIEI